MPSVPALTAAVGTRPVAVQFSCCGPVHHGCTQSRPSTNLIDGRSIAQRAGSTTAPVTVADTRLQFSQRLYRAVAHGRAAMPNLKVPDHQAGFAPDKILVKPLPREF